MGSLFRNQFFLIFLVPVWVLIFFRETNQVDARIIGGSRPGVAGIIPEEKIGEYDAPYDIKDGVVWSKEKVSNAQGGKLSLGGNHFVGRKHLISSIARILQVEATTKAESIHNRNLSELGSEYFREVGERIIDPADGDKNFGYKVSMSDDGRIVAISGMSTSSQTEEHYYRVMVFEEIYDAWYLKGSKIDDPTRTTFFLDDSRAHVSLSGDGMKLAISTVYVKHRLIEADSIPQGTVTVYELGHNNDWVVSAVVYSGNAGAGATVYNGLEASLDKTGSKIAISMRYFDDAGGTSDVGAVMVCEVGNSPSCQIIATGTVQNDNVGSSVMISRNAPYCVVFGVVGSDVGASNSGSASIYCDENENDVWSRRGSPLLGEGFKDEFGFSVAITSDSEYVAVGGWQNDRGGSWSRDDGGHVRVFRFDAISNEYVQIGEDIYGERGSQSGSYYVGDKSGYSLALSDKREDDKLLVAIGAPNNDGDGGYYNGHIRLFECDTGASNPVWQQVLDDINGKATRESAGKSLAMSKDGTRIIFGSPDFEGNGGGYYAGSAMVYELARFTSQPSIAPSVSPTSTLAPSSAPSLSLKVASSPEQEMIFEGVEELSMSAIDHWKDVTEATIWNELSNDSTVTDVEIIVLNTDEIIDRKLRATQSVDAIGGKRIIYEIKITRRVEEEESQYDESIKSVVSEALNSEKYIDDLSKVDSIGEAAFKDATEIKVGELIASIHIRTTYEELYDASNGTTFCLEAYGTIIESSMYARRCDSFEKRQVWSNDSYGQLQLIAFPLNLLCIRSRSRALILDTCDQSDASVGDEMSFTFEDHGDGGVLIRQTKNGNIETGKKNVYYIGIETGRPYSKLQIFKDGSINNSLDKWEVVEGKYSTASESWEPVPL